MIKKKTTNQSKKNESINTNAIERAVKTQTNFGQHKNEEKKNNYLAKKTNTYKKQNHYQLIKRYFNISANKCEISANKYSLDCALILHL